MVKSFIIATVIATIFTSCKQKASRSYNQFLDFKTEEIVAGIAKENVLMGSAVGIAATRPEQWDRYEALLKKASDRELLTYTNHDNPTVRCYSFEALVARKNPDAFSVLLKHLKDTAQVNTLFGCIGSSQPVADYFLQAGKKITLNFNQKQIIDSSLIFDDEITSDEKYSALDSIKKEPKYYSRIREMVLVKNDFKAAPALAKYKKSGDIPIMIELIRSSDIFKQYYGFLSVINYPHPIFFEELKQIISKNVIFKNEYGNEPDFIRRALYSAIIQYKSLSARRLLETEVQNAKGYDLTAKSDLIFQALKQYPDRIYIGVANFNIYD